MIKRLVPIIIAVYTIFNLLFPPSVRAQHPATCSGGTGINTAIGCISFDSTSDIAANFLRVGLGIAGGVSFLMIVYAGFLLITSTGNPERIKQGQDLMTAAFAGLVMIIFSVVILHFIGISILGLRLG